jgi:thiol-disulfide isomerase/thioredoxin
MTIRRTALLAATLIALWGCDKAEEEATATPHSAASTTAISAETVLERLDGSPDPLASYRGKVVVLNIWATWCGPCRQEMASLQRLSDRLDPARFVVLGVAIDENPLLVREYLRAKGIRFSNHIDRGGDRLDVAAVPETFVIGPDGAVRWSGLGERRWDADEAVSWLSGWL